MLKVLWFSKNSSLAVSVLSSGSLSEWRGCSKIRQLKSNLDYCLSKTIIYIVETKEIIWLSSFNQHRILLFYFSVFALLLVLMI